ncbi:hypothetical protein [Nonomuraea rubra]|uniref:Uncharacterized protein n=1 Tax=Nonomuraea rubra TaxID=46180 RepID=A0A7X0U267_9ACTN|nr:hypothetical protein [Nonomuraea rubra]MBB6552421.1 hypothetical protein [Nonomuraea rubra]
MTALPDDGWLAAHAPPWRFRLLPSPRAAEGYTVEDWLALPVTGERIELIDGRYVVSPMPGYASAVAVGRLVGILDAARPGDYEVVAEAKAGGTLTASVPFPITFDPAALTGPRR